MSSDGSAHCWGAGSYSLFGLERPEHRGEPVRVAGVSDAVGIAVGITEACVLSRSGAVSCWGTDRRCDPVSRSMGWKPPIPRAATLVPGLPRAIEIAMGGRKACARAESGEVWCWEGDVAGECPGTMPAVDPWLSRATKLAFAWGHECAISAGDLQCRGANVHGELGDGTKLRRDAPVPVSW